MARDDESMDSIVGMTGSMVDLVKGAREVRRLIREASFDSLTSEFSLDFQVRGVVFKRLCLKSHTYRQPTNIYFLGYTLLVCTKM